MKSGAIVILNYNGVEMLKTFLPFVVTNSTVDLVLIDNGSTDGSVNFFREKYSNIKIIQLSENLGYAGGYNLGLAELRNQYEYYILLNSDVAVTPFWDLDLIAWMELNQSFGVLQPKILSFQDQSKFDYAGAGGGFLDYFGYPFCRGRILNTIEYDSGQYDDAIQVDWASGACMIVRTTDFHDLDGFDGHFFAHMEEIDLCWRIRKTGLKIGYLGKVSVFHLGGATLDRASPKKLELNIRNNLYMLYKMHPRLIFILIASTKTLLEGMAAMAFLLTGKKVFAQSIVRGHLIFWRTRNKVKKFVVKSNERAEIKSQTAVRFLIWNYFVLRRKIFTDL